MNALYFAIGLSLFVVALMATPPDVAPARPGSDPADGSTLLLIALLLIAVLLLASAA